MLPPFTTAAAIQASRAGALEAWVHACLSAEDGNRRLSDGLRLERRAFHGPVAFFPARVLTRCAGPEPGLEFHVTPGSFEARVGRIAAALVEACELPPLIVNYRSGGFTVSDGNHRLEALRRLGRATVPVIVWTTGTADAEGFRRWLRERQRA